MQQILYILPALVCPVAMGALMWFMMRGRGKTMTTTPLDQEQELAQLRQQVQALQSSTPFDERHPAPSPRRDAAS